MIGGVAGELTAYQSLIPSAGVGQMVTVTVSLTYNGQNSTQAVVTPSLPSGVVANGGGQSLELYPGVTQQVSYPLMAEQSGSYWIVSDISYAEGGAWRSLRLEAPFTATGSSNPSTQTQPGSAQDPFSTTPGSTPTGAPDQPYNDGTSAPPNGEGWPENGSQEPGGFPPGGLPGGQQGSPSQGGP